MMNTNYNRLVTYYRIPASKKHQDYIVRKVIVFDDHYNVIRSRGYDEVLSANSPDLVEAIQYLAQLEGCNPDDILD